MSIKSIIHLLPDSVCNQIAAGEVIKNPSFVVKELFENSIDANSTKIILAIEDGGKKLIQVIDDGIGMSDVDARMCLEKHATSKICKSEDLYNINTMGFRGEAISSIISVAQVEIITKIKNIDIGTKIIVEGSKIINQEPYVTKTGTNFIVKNIFYNTPARRKSLKSDEELRKIIKMFNIIALSNPKIEFTFINDGKEHKVLRPTNLFNRVIDIFGDQYKKNLIPCFGEDIFYKLEGFIGTPKSAKRYKTTQFLYVNGRYIKSKIINQVILNAYEKFFKDFDKNKIPFYFLFLTINPSEIDVNMHPSKKEIKFYKEELVCAFIKNTIRESLFKNDLPEIDFNNNDNIVLMQNTTCENNLKCENIINIGGQQEIDLGFYNKKKEEDVITEKKNYDFLNDFSNMDHLKNLECKNSTEKMENNNVFINEENINIIQVKPCFIVSTVKSGVIFIHQRRAHVRILYEKYIKEYEGKKQCSQQLLFPKIINLDKENFETCISKKKILYNIGFLFETKNNNDVIINSSPSNIDVKFINDVFINLLESLRYSEDIDFFHESAKIISQKTAIKETEILTKIEMYGLISQLFLCKNSKFDLNGDNIYYILSSNAILNEF